MTKKDMRLRRLQIKIDVRLFKNLKSALGTVYRDTGLGGMIPKRHRAALVTRAKEAYAPLAIKKERNKKATAEFRKKLKLIEGVVEAVFPGYDYVLTLANDTNSSCTVYADGSDYRPITKAVGDFGNRVLRKKS